MVELERGCGALIARVVGRGATDGVERAIQELGLPRVARLEPEELGAWGVSAAVARKLAAAFELGRAVERGREGGEAPAIGGAADVARLVAPRLRGLGVEVFLALLLDARNRVTCVIEVARGTATSAPVHPREVLGPAVRRGAAALIVAHNHPSGDPDPSEADHAVTRRLVQAGEVLGVPVLDHVIWADRGWVSLRAGSRWPR